MTFPSRASLVVHVQVAEFLVEAERYGVPALAGRPVVVGGSAGSPGRVVAASAEARARRVVPGQPLRDAARLCPHASFRAGDVERQHDLRALIDEILRRHARRLAWISIDEALLHFTPGEAAEARRASEGVRSDLRHELGVSVSVGMAATPVAARVAARMGLPQGLVVVLPGYDARFLAGLPVEEFDVLDPRAVARLHAAGVATVGEVAGLSDEAAFALLGRAGASITRMARGEAGGLPEMTGLPRRMCRQRPLGPSDRPDEAVRDLATELSAALRRGGCAATTLGLRVEDATGASRAHATPLAEPTAGPSVLEPVARRLLARLVPHTAHAHRMSLSASGLVQLPPQGELFDAPGGPAASPRSLAHARRGVDRRRLAG